MLEKLFTVMEQNLVEAGGDACRLFHGRGHCFEGLSFINIDWFAPVVWVVLYGEVEEDLYRHVAAGLCQMAKRHPQVACVIVQRRLGSHVSQEVIHGALPDSCFAAEKGARYELDFSSNQNIGFFLDACPARQWLRGEAEGRRVLNLFAYTCSFSVAAMQGGAAGVVNIDMAKAAIAVGQKNHAMNGLDIRKVRFLPHDIFRSTRKLEDLGPYDIVVIDPPSRQKGSFEAEKDYGRLLQKLQPMLAEGALILACLNAPYLGSEFLVSIFAENLPRYSLLQRLAQREDFPEADAECCLKMLVFGELPSP